MKKFTTLFLALMLTFILTACGGETAPDTDGTTPSQNAATNDTGKTEDNEISFTETVVVDNEECLIKITEIHPDHMDGMTLKVQLENKSANKTYMFAVENAAINGIQWDPFFASEVAAGKKSNEEIIFQSEELKENGVGDYTDIELFFNVYDSNDWNSDPVAEETIHIYPYGEDKAVKFVREAQASDNIILDNESVTAIVTGYEKDELLGYTVHLFLLNKTDHNVMFSVDEASVNGYMVDPFYASSLAPGKCTFSSMSWPNSLLEENSITDIEEIEFKLQAYNEDDFTSDDLANELITLNP